MNLAFLKIFEGLFSQASKIVDETITTKEEKLQKRNELEQIFNDGKTKAVELALKEQEIQASTIKKEMEGSSLQRNWRPLTALIFVFIVFCNFFLFPVINIFARSEELLLLIKQGQQNENFWNLLYIMIGGYTVGRSAEKVTEKVITKKANEK
jgi:uncharacterized membrane protein YgcG